MLGLLGRITGLIVTVIEVIRVGRIIQVVKISRSTKIIQLFALLLSVVKLLGLEKVIGHVLQIDDRVIRILNRVIRTITGS